jgi:peptidoglycan/LPS O-acetylase OafA/YrhL
VPWVVIFAGNFVRVHQASHFALGALGHMWSLAVEEQFYLLWPALFVLLMRRGTARSRLAVSLGGVAVAEMIYGLVMTHLGYSPYRIYYGTDTHSDGLLMGCALAFWLASRPTAPRPGAPDRLRAGLWLAVGVLVVLFLIGRQANAPIEVPVAVFATTAVVVGVVRGRTPPGLDRVLLSRWAIHIGRRSYGLYLWHFVLIATAEALVAPITGVFPAAGGPKIAFATVIGVAAAASFVAADLSYRFVELPALRLKRRFSSQGADGSAISQPEPGQPVGQPWT